MEQSKNRVIVETLKGEILGGKWLSSTRPFPSERALAKRFDVSRPTISQALQELRGQGYLTRRRGSGTFLTQKGRNAGGRIGLIIPGISHEEIFPPICRELSTLAQTHGYALLFADISSRDPRDRAETAKTLAEEYAKQGVSGVIFQPIEFVRDATRINREILAVFDRAKIPVVLLDYDVVPPPERSAYDLVAIDNFDAGRRLAIHLVAAGAKRIAFLMRPNWGFSVRDRLVGVKYVATETERSAKTIKLVCEPDDVAAIRKALGGRNAPDAIVCGNDTAAAKLLTVLRKLGKRVPQDVMVAGFDDVQHATLVSPPLTTIHQPCEALARTVFDVLTDRINVPGREPRKITLEAPLVTRDSTRREGKSRGF